MRYLVRPKFLLSFMLCAMVLSGGLFLAQPAPDHLAVGDKEFEEKSYRRAFEAYDAYLKQNPESENRYRVMLRMGHCQIQLENYDEAEAALIALADAEWLTNIQRARANYRLGYMYLDRPKTVWENHEGERSWGRRIQSARSTNMTVRDHVSAAERLATADTLFRPLAEAAIKDAGKAPAHALEMQEEAFNIGMDYTAALQALQFVRGTERKSFEYLDANNNKRTWWFNERTFEDRDEILAGYDRMVDLGNVAAKIAASQLEGTEGDDRKHYERLRDKGRNMAAMAMYRKGSFKVSLCHIDDHNFAMLIRVREGSGFDPIAGEYNPIPTLTAVYTAYPESAYADHAIYTAGYVYSQIGRYTEAVATFDKLIADERFADSSETSSAKALRAALLRQSLSVATLAEDREIKESREVHRWANNSHWQWRVEVGVSRSLFKPGEHIGLWVESRNAANYKVRALAFDVAGFMRDPEFLAAEASGFSALDTPATREVRDRYTGEAIWEHELATGDGSEHMFNRHTFELPEKLDVGAYIIEVDAGDVLDRRVIVVSNLQIVTQTYDHARNQILVVDATTGQPMADPRITYKRWGTTWDRNTRTNIWHIDHGTFTGDELGRLMLPVHRLYNAHLMLAEVAGQFAFHQAGIPWWQLNPSGAGIDERFFHMSDRPVYRPGDTVYLKSIVRSRLDGQWANRQRASYHVRITDPRGQEHFNRVLTVTEYGALELDLELPKDAALGRWTVRVNRGQNWVSSTGFVVEEYRKPDLEVKVSPPERPVRLGNSIGATISAEYYFGGAAIDADVSYKVFRTFYRHRVQFPRRFDWLYNIQRPAWAGTPDQQFNVNTRRELVTEGQGKLDENGELVIEWSTKKALEDYGNFDHQYIVEAQVTDSSRRTVNGSGNVKALRNAFFAFVDNQRGYYRPGDALALEIRTLDADDRAVTTTGRLEFYRVMFQHVRDAEGLPRINELKTLAASHDFATDEHGRAFYTEKVKESGTYDVVYVTKDDWGNEIRGTTRIVVQADKWMPGSFRFGNVSVTPMESVYVEGETARALIASDIPNSWMLISVVGGHTILDQQYVALGETGGQFEIEIPIDRKHLPNFHIHVLTVRDGELHTQRVEMFVPPDDQFLEVEVTTDKEVYQPGETGTLTVTAKDKFGNPVQAEFALTVYDRSIQYIVPENIPNIIAHYYRDRRGFTMGLGNSYSTNVHASQHRRATPESHRYYGGPIAFGVRNWIGFERRFFDFNAETQDRSERFRQAFADVVRTDVEEDVDEARFGTALRRSRGGSGAPAPGMDPEGAVGLGGGAGGGASGGFAGRRAQGGMADGAEAPGADESYGEPEENARKNELGEALRDVANSSAEEGEEGELATPRIRSDFRDSAFYSHQVTTSPEGVATVEVTFPDNLTDWRIAARGITRVAKVGEGFTSARTSKRLLMRDIAPRFVVEGDVVTLSGIIMNRYDTDLDVRAMLMLNPGDTATEADLAAFSKFELFPETPDIQSIVVPAGGEVRVDWRVRMTGAGLFRVRMIALSAIESDAAQRDYDCKIRGAEMVQAHSAVIADEEYSQEFTFSLPEKMDPEQTYMDLQLSPSVAALAMDALPYLLEFPYGCVEQTMSRFMPAVLVQHTLRDAGVSLEDIGKRRMQLDYEGVNPQAAYWYRRNPVFDTGTMNAIVSEGLRRIAIMQRGDGGWGWWRGAQADLYMTAYVVYGLQTAVNAGVVVDKGMLERGVKFMVAEARRERNLHRAAYVAYSLAHAGAADKELLDKLYERRDDLNHQTRAMLCMAQFMSGDEERARIMLRNIEDYRKEDLTAGTVWWDGGRDYWNWWNDRIETNAFVMRAFTMVDPKNDYLERHVRWLTQNRKGSRWNSTKDTSHAISALMSYARVSGELERSYSVDVKMNGETIHQWDVTPQNIFTLQSNLRLRSSQLPPGNHTFTIEREGEGKVYFSAYVTYFSKEDRLEATGNHISIRREYHRLIERTEEVEVEVRNADGTTRKVTETRLRYDRVPLEYGETLKSGDLIEVSLNVRSDNDYEYLMFEDFKPAGCEPVALRSGRGYQGGMIQNVELRDDRVAFFVSYMQQGAIQLRYQLRCETPGTFSALPTQGGSMYVPEVRANSEEFKLSIIDRE